MKRIGIICALEEELKELLKFVTFKKEKDYYDIKVLECSLEKQELFLVQCGVGKVNAARTTQILIDHYNPDIIMNMGVAGSVSKEVGVCDVVIGDKLVQHDFDVTPFGYEKGCVPHVGVYIESDKELVKIAQKVNQEAHTGVIASGDIFCTDKKLSENISKTFHALCVEMEGASIAQVCFLANIPFLVLRSISDSPDGSDNKLTYEEFLEISSKKVANMMKEIILKIEK